MVSDPPAGGSEGISAASTGACGSTATTAAANPASGSAEFREPTAHASAAKRPRLADSVTAATAGNDGWAEAISALQPAIVALRVTCVRSFEEDPAATAQGTGFVVDRANGLILTNRHITGVGPVRATAIFDRHEELEVEVIYRDPIHDFGFFRYDPAKLRLTRGAEVQLHPEGLRVGTEIRVVGNDAGEKLQILSGTIARIDRNVPEFSTIYNDENTFYAGAGAGTSGGSSGSPVLNKDGKAIALNAAGQEGTASAFFLPLYRVRYSFELLRQGKSVPRGTCMASFLFKPFDELIRVGLQQKHEQDVLKTCPDATGMLLVDSVLCEQKVLRPGDILLRLEGEACIGFVELEAAMDSHVGDKLAMLVCRGGSELSLEVNVADLHALIPRSFVELGLDTLHGLGYHAARRAHLPLDTGMYLARSGYVFDSVGCTRASLVTTVGKTWTPTAETFVKALEDIPDRQYFPVSWYELAEFRRDRNLKTGFAKMSRAWSPLRLWRCMGGSGGGPERWVATDLPEPTRQPQVAAAPGPIGSLTGGNRLVRQLQASLVTVKFRTDRRFCTEANYQGCADGTGILVDAEQGLVLTDRHSAPQSLGDVEVTLAGAAAVDGEVIFIHPLHNIAVVRCDPQAMAGLKKAKVPLQAARLAKGDKGAPHAGEELHFVGFDNQGNTFSARVTVAAVYLPSGRDEFPLGDMPRFREKNLEIVVLADTPEDARSGILCDATGAVRALFAAFDWQGPQREETTEAFGISASVFELMLADLSHRPEAPLQVPSLDVEVSAIDVATLARGSSGRLPKDWLQAVGKSCGKQGQVARAMRVHRILPTGASEGRLRPGDVLLSVAGRTIACSLDVEKALHQWLSDASSRAAGRGRTVAKRPAAASSRARSRSRASGTRSSGGGAAAKALEPVAVKVLRDGEALEPVAVKVLRDGEEVDVSVMPALLGSEDDARLVLWAGFVLRRTPRCILERCGESVAKVAGGVFVQNILGGSPADARELNPHCFLLELDGQHIRDLSDVLRVLRSFSVGGASGSKAGGAVGGAASAGVAQGAPEASGAAVTESVQKEERHWVRLRLVDLYGQEHVRALQCDPLFFPTLDLQREKGGRWHCHRLAY